MTLLLRRSLAILLVLMFSFSLAACRSGNGASDNPLLPAEQTEEDPDDNGDNGDDPNGDDPNGDDPNGDDPDGGDSNGDDPLSELDITRSHLPSGVPPAALADEREREAAIAVSVENVAFWPFEEGAPRTSGTGRYAHGAYYWTDFIYDADGARGVNPPAYRIGTPSGGSLRYPDGDSAGNGADIFRVGIGADDAFTYWRVDWQTLVSADVPIAAFALDFDPQEPGPLDALPVSSVEWPGVPRLFSPGIDAVLLVSAHGVFLDQGDGDPQQAGELVVDAQSRSFLARVPRENLPGVDTAMWRIRLASGLNDGEGNFLGSDPQDMLELLGLVTQPPVFNMAFRDYELEPAENNYWFNDRQAQELAQNNGTPFFIDLEWERLGATEAEPELHGYSNRWYVSSAQFERSGIETGPNPTVNPQYFDQVQPYGIYIPSSYDANSAEPMPLTWMLHSLTQNHNQYGANLPNFQQEACEQRQSVCVTTLGRGPAGWYVNEAELDLWEVWHNVARYFPLDPERTITSGYSMGAGGSFALTTRYPDVFAGGVFLAGQPGFAQIGNVTQQLENLKWTGYYQAHGTFDQLVPFPDAIAGANRMEALGYRYIFDHYLAEDHVVWTLKDGVYSAFSEAASWITEMAAAGRKRSPGDFVFRWRGSWVDTGLGIGPGTSDSGPWWLSALQAAPDSSESIIRAHSQGRPEQPVVPVALQQEFLLTLDTPSPALRSQQVWNSVGEPPEVGGRITLELQAVEALRLDMADAGVAARNDKLLCLDSDASTQLVLLNLPDGILVAGSAGIGEVVVDGTVSFVIAVGETIVTFSDSNVPEDLQAACGFD